MDKPSIQHKSSHSPGILERCRSLRKNATNAENLLWQLLRNRQLMGFKFRRQYPIASYVVDFYCHEARLIIELDGNGHADDKQAAYDADRTHNLEALGLNVIRFWNNQVLQETQAVLQTIADELMNHVDDVN
jgi:very-short-patch-repair endonuclease